MPFHLVHPISFCALLRKANRAQHLIEHRLDLAKFALRGNEHLSFLWTAAPCRGLHSQPIIPISPITPAKAVHNRTRPA